VNAGLSVDMIRGAIQVCLMVSAPLLLTALIVGVGVSVVQAVTQIQEQTLTFVPKLMLLGLVFLVTLPWVLRQLVDYLVTTLRSLPGLGA
jgi:flagellar biosynthesis protein FliQ